MITLNAENGDRRLGLAKASVLKKYRQSHGQSPAKVARQLQGQRGDESRSVL
jgi:hypothetical protein